MATPPASWENATPVFGIRYPKPTAPAKYLPDMFQHTGLDVEAALIADQSVPPGLNYRTGTKAERLVATPAKDQVWVETDTGDQYIGTGTVWLLLTNGAPDSGWVDIAIASGYAALSTAERPQVRRIGDIVWTRGAWATTGIGANTAQNVGTIPAGYRPGLITFQDLGTWTTDVRGKFVIPSEGTIELRVTTPNPHYFLTAPWVAA